MSNLNSKFDIVSRDPHPNARAGLMVVLDVHGATGPYVGAGSSGTPIPGVIAPGSIVVMEQTTNTGEAILANNADVDTAFPTLMFITVDGDMDFDGAYSHRITCIQGGCEIVTDLFAPDSYNPGDMLTCGDDAVPLTDHRGYFRKAVATEQIYGIVGSDGLDTVENVLHVIIPQGLSPAMI